jgi:integrase
MPKLSDTKIRSAKPKEKPYKLYDGDGLLLIVTPEGSRWWRQRYHFAGKEQSLSIGVYPQTTLAEAREKGAALRKQVANGINPSTDRQQRKAEQLEAAARTYKVVAAEWLERTSKARKWTTDHSERVRRRLEVHFFPWLARKSIAEVTEDDIITCVRRMEDRNIIDTARRALAEQDELFRAAKVRKYVKYNPVADLRGPDLLPRPKVKHHAGLTDPAQFGALLRAVDAYPGGFVVREALRFAPLVFVRPGELREAQWHEFDLDAKTPEWRIPADRMKMAEQHIVPLARQAVAVLRELYSLTGTQGYLFPSVRNASRPMSNNTINAALRTCGFTAAQQTGHGFRTTASTLLNEQGWNADAIERQLAHGPRDKVRAAYNSAQYLPERRKMMQAWADYLDRLRGGAKVIPIKRFA